MLILSQANKVKPAFIQFISYLLTDRAPYYIAGKHWQNDFCATLDA